ncbi:hypothetical protein fugu_013053 [Takifugu bimaculatus]|uniref:Uncharacterized protein n=1 Tax=Takifugu bimaculatus TaxID=433685 RepID=A0A4Z2C7B1_9TELE|nr:hypothetical protein fugu_013053 [Takifugu bimaculatus]
MNKVTYQLVLHTRKRISGLFDYPQPSQAGLPLNCLCYFRGALPASQPPPVYSRPGFNIDTDGRVNVILVSTSILLECVSSVNLLREATPEHVRETFLAVELGNSQFCSR